LAESELQSLTLRVDAMRAVLVRLLQDVVHAEALVSHAGPAALVEANEHLVVAALLSQFESDTAAQALDDATRAGEIDALTQLPNRARMLDRFALGIANAKRSGTRLALLFLDLDNFKRINDQSGHAAGDAALRRVARCLQSVVRAVDTVSRHGGDEFVVLLAELAQRPDAGPIAEKLIAAVSALDQGSDLACRVSACIGISVYPDDAQEMLTLIAQADAAMYVAKRHGTGQYAFHGEEVAARGRDKPPSAGETGHRSVPLREVNEQLVLAVLGARELQTAAELAQQRQSAFMAAVAQELRNPMAPIRIAAEMLGHSGSDELLLQRVNEIVQEQVGQMARLVSDRLDDQRASSAELVLDRRPLDMAQVIAGAVATSQPMMRNRHQDFACRVPEGALPVLGDAQRLAQLVVNLLDNASRHTPDGGRITLDATVPSDTDAEPATLTLTVADTGLGIAPQMLPHVFEPFVQDTAAIGLRGGGLGIGLTVARALARAHGGSIVAHSAGSGQGSAFIVTLPMSRASDPAGEAAARAEPP
jgi:diguanylate cyclase (GGDEF)-like protein